MLKDLPPTIGNRTPRLDPAARYWAYYTWQEIDAIAKRDPNATAVINIGAVEQHGPHLPLITDTLVGMELLGAALARLPEDAMVLALPPTNFGKSTEHTDFPGTLTFSGETLRMVLRDLALSVARSGFSKLVLLGSHGGNVGTLDDVFRDLRHRDEPPRLQDLPRRDRPGAGAGRARGGGHRHALRRYETSMVRYLTPELVHMDRAEGWIFDPTPDIGYSFKGNDVIEAWVASDLSRTGAIGNPHPSSTRRASSCARPRPRGWPSCWWRSTRAASARSVRLRAIPRRLVPMTITRRSFLATDRPRGRVGGGSVGARAGSRAADGQAHVRHQLEGAGRAPAATTRPSPPASTRRPAST
jgi:creatinine amidohydrolase/Fe(II)-dependent formamide hydrolase-like protein